MKIKIYQDQNGREPFNDWLAKLKNFQLEFKIHNRFDRIEEYGIFGDYKRIDPMIYELRFHTGSGYRVYFSYLNRHEILILCGGDKSTQKRDIEKAKQYLEYYNDYEKTIH